MTSASPHLDFTRKQGVPPSEAIAIVQAGRRPDLVEKIGGGPVMGSTAVLDDVDLTDGLHPNRETLVLHEWLIPGRRASDDLTVYVLIRRLTDMYAPDVSETIVVTEYDLTNPAVLSAVLKVTGDDVISPSVADARWASTNSQVRLTQGLKGLPEADAAWFAGQLAEFNDELRDRTHTWVDAVHELRQADPRPLPVPVAGWRQL
jgi:hypothetical protein